MLAQRHDIGPDLNFLIWYTDPTDGDLLPINNDNNLARALLAAKSLLRIFIQRKGQNRILDCVYLCFAYDAVFSVIINVAYNYGMLQKNVNTYMKITFSIYKR